MKHGSMLCRLVAVLTMTVAVWPMAAQPGFTPGAESKRLEPQVLAEAVHAGSYNGLQCVVAQGAKEFAPTRKNNFVVLLLDHNLEPVSTFELPQSDNLRLLAAKVRGQNLGALLVDEDDEATTVYSASLDLGSMQLSSGTSALTLVERFAHSKKDRCMVWGAASPGGTHYGMVAVVEYTDKEQYSSLAMMMDSTMRPEWRKDYAMGSMEQLWATDDGRLVSLGVEHDADENHIIFNVANIRQADSYDAVIKCDPIAQLSIANVIGPHVVAMGTFRPAGSHPDDNLCGGVVALSFNTDSAIISNFMMHPFVNEDITILLNRHTKKRQSDLQPDMVRAGGTAPLPWGAAIAVGRSYVHSHVEANGVPSYRYCKEGLQVVAVDSLAHLRFVRNLRRNDVQSASNNLLRASLFAWGDTLCVVKSEHPKYPAIYDIAKPAKEWEAGAKCNLVLYAIAPDGQVDKHLLEAKTRQAFLAAWPSFDGGWTLLSCRGNRTRAAQLSSKH